MSGEEGMEIPPSRLSIEPEAPALLILQSPVVTRGAGLSAPPFWRDAGRTLGAPHTMTAPLPEEFLRRGAPPPPTPPPRPAASAGARGRGGLASARSDGAMAPGDRCAAAPAPANGSPGEQHAPGARSR